MDLTITPRVGIGEVRFGMSVEEIVQKLGTADEVESIENAEDESTTVLRYAEEGVTLFLESDNPKLECADISNEDCLLWGEKVFFLDERAIVKLMVEHNYTEQDVDDEDWGERRVSFPQGNIDFFFDEGELVSIILGA